MDYSPLEYKSRDFAIRIVKFYRFLLKEKQEFILAKQILRSGTSIGANIAEGHYGQSDADLINKYSIAQKEAAETEYWLDVLRGGDCINDNEYHSLKEDVVELLKLLTSAITKMKSRSSNP